MKKRLAVFMVFATLSLSVVAALAVLPHSHGKELDHAGHEDCPIHQFNLQGVSAVLVQAAVLTVVFAFIRSILFFEADVPEIYRTFASLRAPPTQA